MTQYLGNLNHAKNGLMLLELGITHVLSMGESALSPPPPSSHRLRKNSQSRPSNSLYHLAQQRLLTVLDIPSFQDDGMDSLSPHLGRVIEWIENARKEGGTVLVHCRVGVSRSASVVIAYLMRFLELDLKSAWLLVRSRRLVSSFFFFFFWLGLLFWEGVVGEQGEGRGED